MATTVAALAGAAPNKIWAWGSDRFGETDVPPGLTNVVAIAAGLNHSMALNGDGTVVVWGQNTYGETNVPPGLSNVVSIAAGSAHCLALKSNGTVVAWGWNIQGQTNVPSVITNVPGHIGQRLTNVIAIAGGGNSSLALTKDGSLVGWGDNTHGQLNIPAGLSNVVAIAGGAGTFMALRSNGTVAVWGPPAIVPPGLSNVVAIGDGESELLALVKDGSVVMWDQSGNVTAGPTNVSAVVGDYANSVFLLRDGTVAVWGDDTDGITNVPVGLTNVTAIAGDCSMHVLALAPDQTLTAAPPETLTGALGPESTNAVLNALVWPDSLPTGAWFEWGTTTNYGNVTPTIPVGNSSASVSVSATITGLIPLTTYDYRVVASNSMGYSYGGNANFTTIPISNYVNGITVTNSVIRLWSTAISSNAAQPSVWATTNLANWTRLGSAVQTTPGVFEFLDQSPTNSNQRFYRLSWP